MIELTLCPTDDIQTILDAYHHDDIITLNLTEGIFRQKLTLHHNHLTVIGASQSATVIAFNDFSYKMHEDGLLFNTFRTSTVTILGSDITLKHLTITNTAGCGLTIGQAIALSVYGTRFMAYDCTFSGYQDTLFIGPLPVDLVKRYEGFLPPSYLHTHPVVSKFEQCTISGDVDFIFGSGMAWFDTCVFIAVKPGYIFAPSTYEIYPFGMIVMRSSFMIKEPTFIARPWRDHAKVHLIECIFKGPINEARYDDWNKTKFTFKEYPYFSSSFSSLCDVDERHQLETFIGLNF